MRIRKCRPEDERAIFELACDFATSFPVEREGFSRAFAQILSSPDMHLAVSEAASNVMTGYVLGTAHPTFYASGNVAWVEEIMVKEDFRRQGVGKMLMKNFESWAASKSCRLIALATRRAADFYTSLEYEESAIYYRKLLRPPRRTIHTPPSPL